MNIHVVELASPICQDEKQLCVQFLSASFIKETETGGAGSGKHLSFAKILSALDQSPRLFKIGFNFDSEHIMEVLDPEKIYSWDVLEIQDIPLDIWKMLEL